MATGDSGGDGPAAGDEFWSGALCTDVDHRIGAIDGARDDDVAPDDVSTAPARRCICVVALMPGVAVLMTPIDSVFDDDIAIDIGRD